MTVATTSPKTLERSAILGHPPIETSPRPSATGSLQRSNGSAIGRIVALGEGDGLATLDATFTPLFHTNFFPDFTHVYFSPPAVVVAPALVQVPPAFTAASAGESKPKARRAMMDAEIVLFMG